MGPVILHSRLGYLAQPQGAHLLEKTRPNKGFPYPPTMLYLEIKNRQF